MVSDALTILLGLSAGLVLEFGVLYLVQKPHLLAEPTLRSSHTEPTPTMGGVVIVLVVLAYFGFLGNVEARLGWGLFSALAALALIGLWDDLSGLSARLRLAVHFLAVILVLWSLQPAQPLWLLAVFLIGLVWLINLYNFMDGIDGFAAMQCLIYCLGAQWLATGVPGWTGDLLWLLAGSTLAFLAFNWPPAKIFMGDVASGFLGLLIGALSLYLWQSGSVALVSSMILLSVFWFDATYTLCVRIVTRQAFTHAHRAHVYQHIAQRNGHLWTTLAFLIYAAVWLLPMAWLAMSQAEYPLRQIFLLVVSVLPMAILCWRFGAGMQYRES